jgi:hypothetical protein
MAPSALLNFPEFIRYQLRQLYNLEGMTTKSYYFAGQGEWASFHVVLANLVEGAGIPVLSAAVLGTILLWRRSRFAALILAGVAIVYSIILGFTAAVPYHYVLLLCPFISALAAVAAAWIVRLSRFTRISAAAILLILLASPIYRIIQLERILSGTDTRRKAELWCYSHLMAGTRIDHEIFGPIFTVPMFDVSTVPVFRRQRWIRYVQNRNPQYYVEDSLTSELFDGTNSRHFPVESEWLSWIRTNGSRTTEFTGQRYGLYNPKITIFQLPDNKLATHKYAQANQAPAEPGHNERRTP